MDQYKSAITILAHFFCSLRFHFHPLLSALLHIYCDIFLQFNLFYHFHFFQFFWFRNICFRINRKTAFTVILLYHHSIICFSSNILVFFKTLFLFLPIQFAYVWCVVDLTPSTPICTECLFVTLLFYLS